MYLRISMIKKVFVIFVVLLNIGCDQLSKELVRDGVKQQAYIELIDDYFILTKVENTGAMLGLGQNLPPILKIVLLQAVPVLVLFIILVRILRKSNMDYRMMLAFAFVIGGGIGNLIDRIAHGSVTDFFQIKVGIFKTGIFNMADMSVTFGILLLLIFSFTAKKASLHA